ncbi:MAG: chromosome partitioning protein ParB [Pelagibacteraceae bacterium TMED287]|nr:MAG: chromosome partitioning protein ParB [Pelagibacteraceae bacterium TMED287]|tara:strand:+ start:2929 stop:3792 length:864 start_codon:yes stop_codon:yes gene_type:complete
MSQIKKKGLGRGLSALFGETKSENTGNEVKDQSTTKVLIGDLNRNQFQPRYNFDEEKLNELSKSIKQNGIIQPIAVRLDKNDPKKYEIIAGERRWIAAQKAGLHEVPIVIHKLNDVEALEVAILENIQREDLNSVEEAKGFERLKNEFGYDHEKIAKIMSKSRSHISNSLRLLTLPEDVIKMLEEGEITAGQARPLIGLPDPSAVAEEIVKKKISARGVETLVKNKKTNSKKSLRLDSNIINTQDQIESSLGLKVIISNTKKNTGKISIEYKNLEQFDLIAGLLKRS